MQAVTSSSLLRFPATSSTLTGSIMAAGFMLDPGGNLLPMPALPTPSPVTSENQCSICSHPSCTGGSACLLSFCSCYFMLYLHFLQLLLVVISWFHLVFVSYGLFCLYTFNLVAIGYPLVFSLSIYIPFSLAFIAVFWFDECILICFHYYAFNFRFKLIKFIFSIAIFKK